MVLLYCENLVVDIDTDVLESRAFVFVIIGWNPIRIGFLKPSLSSIWLQTERSRLVRNQDDWKVAFPSC